MYSLCQVILYSVGSFHTLYIFFFFQLKVSEHQRLTHLKVNSVQVDNQMSDVLFPVVLARVPPPRSVMAETGGCSKRVNKRFKCCVTLFIGLNFSITDFTVPSFMYLTQP